MKKHEAIRKIGVPVASAVLIGGLAVGGHKAHEAWSAHSQEKAKVEAAKTVSRNIHELALPVLDAFSHSGRKLDLDKKGTGSVDFGKEKGPQYGISIDKHGEVTFSGSFKVESTEGSISKDFFATYQPKLGGDNHKLGASASAAELASIIKDGEPNTLELVAGDGKVSSMKHAGFKNGEIEYYELPYSSLYDNTLKAGDRGFGASIEDLNTTAQLYREQLNEAPQD